jgi:thioesterase domain-containing protein
LELVRAWEQVLDVRPIGVRDSFFDLGGHSLLAVRLLAHLQQSLGQTLPLAALFEAKTVEELARWLRQGRSHRSYSPIIAIQPQGNKLPFFCVHPAGGNVLCYARLAHHLGLDRPFYGLQARGLSEEEEPITTVSEMAARYIEALRKVQSQGPYLLGGWSMGGVVAFEMAQQLLAQNQPVALLALLDSWLLNSKMARQLGNDNALLTGFAQDLGLALDQINLHSRAQPETLNEQLSFLLERARQANALLPDLDLAQFGRLFRVYQANVRALRAYAPRVYQGQLLLLQTERSAADLREFITPWSDLALGGVATYSLPGTHFTLVREPFVRTLADRLKACLDQAQATSA